MKKGDKVKVIAGWSTNRNRTGVIKVISVGGYTTVIIDGKRFSYHVNELTLAKG
jgi:hypothetical protein